MNLSSRLNFKWGELSIEIMGLGLQKLNVLKGWKLN
jgi:hypothetical protein